MCDHLVIYIYSVKIELNRYRTNGDLLAKGGTPLRSLDHFQGHRKEEFNNTTKGNMLLKR